LRITTESRFLAALGMTAFAFLASVAEPTLAQDALRGKRLYHDIGPISGAGVSCIDCHGGIPGALHGIGKAANNPAAIDYALNVIQQMTPLRGRVSQQDMADLAAYIGAPHTPSPDLRIETSGPAANRFTAERLEFRPGDRSVVKFTNTGRLPLQLQSAPAISGPDAGTFFIAASDCRAELTLGPGMSCSVDITFRPAPPASNSTSLRSARLGISHDWIRGEVAVALLGRTQATGIR